MMRILTVLVLVFAFATGVSAQTNLMHNPGLEMRAPNFWQMMNAGETGVGLVWATDTAAAGEYSLKITKTAATTNAVGWQSVNNANLYWNHAEAGAYTLKFKAKTEGVNTSPADDNAKFGVLYKFLDAGGNTIGEQLVAVDQSAANTTFSEYQGALVLASAPDQVLIELVGGKDATGTVWFDNISCGTDPWSMGVFNGDCEIPVSWMKWHTDHGYAGVVDDTVHNGNYSVLVEDQDDSDDEIVWYSVPTLAEAGEWYKIGVWVKTEGINTDTTWHATNVTPDRDNDRIGITFFFHKGPIETGWDLVGGDQFFYIDQRTGKENEDWTHYVVIALAPEEAAGVSMRARFTSFPTGKVWYDDFSIEKLDVQPEILANPGVETRDPNFWNKMNAGETGVELVWAKGTPLDTAAAGEYSLKIAKSAATTNAVGWQSDNNANLYWNHAEAGAYTLKFKAETQGVNTSPANDDAKFGVLYKFLDTGGNTIGEQLVAVDQSVGGISWSEYQGAIVLASAPDQVIIELVGGKDATGTVWFDNISCGTDPWSMGLFNGDCEIPVSWMKWHTSHGYAGVVDDTVHSGDYAVLVEDQDDSDDEIVWYSEPGQAEAGEWYRVSVWVKTEGINTDTSWHATNVTPDRDNDRIGMTFFFHKGPIETGWDLVGGDQFFYIDQRTGKENEDWKQYNVIAMAPEEAAGVSVRARFTSFPTGKVWYDDFSVQKVNMVISAIEPATNNLALTPSEFELGNNYPNPFNPETIFEYRVPVSGRVHIAIFNVLGQKVRTLVDQDQVAGVHHVMWDGKDNAGNRLATGMYFYQLRGDNALITKKMTMIK